MGHVGDQEEVDTINAEGHGGGCRQSERVGVTWRDVEKFSPGNDISHDGPTRFGGASKGKSGPKLT